MRATRHKIRHTRGAPPAGRIASTPQAPQQNPASTPLGDVFAIFWLLGLSDDPMPLIPWQRWGRDGEEWDSEAEDSANL